MKSLIMLASSLILSLSAAAGVNPTTEKENAKETATYTTTIGALKALYGAENVVIEGDVAVSDEMVVEFAANPCAGTGLQNCEQAFDQARRRAQRIANDCCCTINQGVECCDPSTGSQKAILFLVEPNSPNCN